MTRDSQFISDAELNALNSASYLALCPLDGRYVNIAKMLAPYFSEYALVKNRVKVEVEWLCFVIDHLDDPNSTLWKYYNGISKSKIRDIYNLFDKASFNRVKAIEEKTNHDVKAVEYFIDEKLDQFEMSDLKSFVHIGCTSEDITNPAYAIMIEEAINEIWLPSADELVSIIFKIAYENRDTSMLAHTHGQPATPTTIGKELLVASHRLSDCIEDLRKISVKAKFNGATGNYSAISIAFPDERWPDLAKMFVTDYLKLEFNPITTQIESHDYICKIADCIRRFNNILVDYDLDMWLYISMGYFSQIVVKDEVGSSTMPHKVNPIKFENSEANVCISNALLTALADKLPRSRMQRDLSDSSTMRNVGMAIGYSLQAILQTTAGFKKVKVNCEKLAEDLNNRWEVLAEPIQTMLRKYGIPDAYEKLKELTRGRKVTEDDIHDFIFSLYDTLSKDDLDILLSLTPKSYTGWASMLVENEIID